MSDKQKEALQQFDDVRKQYNSELKDLRDKYEPKFQEILEGVKGEVTSKETD